MVHGKMYVETFGCSLNLSDTELLIGELLKKGLTVSNLDEADVIIVNTCAVKDPTERKVLNYLKSIDRLDKAKIIVGCLPKVNLEGIKKAIPSFNAIITPSAYPRISEVIDLVLKGVKGLIINAAIQPPLFRDFQIKRKIGIIPIAYGCVSECSYCCVRFARGKLQSYFLNQIIEYASRLVERGCVELWLTAQDTAAYGLDINTDLSQLIAAINMMPGDFKVRVGMMNPKNAYKITNSLVEAFNGEKIYKFIHLPVQSGDDLILKKMNRGYTVAMFREIINRFREKHPNITVSTDIIVGFPGESEINFENSLKLIQIIQPDIVNISRYGDRPGAASVNLPDKIKGSVIKRRSRILTELVREITLGRNAKWLNWTGETVIVEEARNGYIARNYAYKPIFLKNTQLKLGGKYLIRIVDYKPGYLIGELA